jgi:hypothetical protein
MRLDSSSINVNWFSIMFSYIGKRFSDPHGLIPETWTLTRRSRTIFTYGSFACGPGAFSRVINGPNARLYPLYTKLGSGWTGSFCGVDLRNMLICDSCWYVPVAASKTCKPITLDDRTKICRLHDLLSGRFRRGGCSCCLEHNSLGPWRGCCRTSCAWPSRYETGEHKT